ncbi:hypothetical protein LBMAG53_36950 [Planctomycetota bacterium]|nr:hypothetical protein LBMAG53_36950 [Planctomycetota bacterium]
MNNDTLTILKEGGWREYSVLIKRLIAENRIVPTELLIAPIIENPENYKIISIIEYYQAKSMKWDVHMDQIQNSILGIKNTDYQNHLLNLLNKFKH